MLFLIRVSSRSRASCLRFVGSAARAASRRRSRFGPNERWVFDQVNNFLPHDLVEQVLTDRPTVAHRPAEMAPSVGAEAAVVMDFARGGAGRRPRQRIAAFA